ncbi:hypothetical protein ACFYUV_20705 [Nonomuraea sp. NPDC003560]|uniref:hypothetical protein n=1 Tax=Nonomuraea sp. NPDC003560 TaxID=3364341 RepID=UPI003689B3FD
MKRLFGDEDLRTCLIAAIIKDGGSLEVSFDAFGEAALTAKIDDVRPTVERTATGLRFTLTRREEG